MRTTRLSTTTNNPNNTHCETTYAIRGKNIITLEKIYIFIPIIYFTRVMMDLLWYTIYSISFVYRFRHGYIYYYYICIGLLRRRFPNVSKSYHVSPPRVTI